MNTKVAATKKRLFQVLDEYVQNPLYPMHMPGHKRRYKTINFEELDYTEISGLDNLQKPEECIKVTQEAIAKVFKSDESHILVNGSTVGILASIMGTVSETDSIIVARNCHQSVLNAVTMAKCTHTFIYPKINNKGIVTNFNITEIEDVITSTKNVKALVITSPTYEGVVMDVEKIAALTKKYGITFIVDEAHGAYFVDKTLPKSAVLLGADVVVQSLHKTLPAPTQTSVLHISKNCKSSTNIKRYLNMLQTTSPSYFFMYCIDKLVYEIETGKLDKHFKHHFKRITAFREKFKSINDLGIIELFESNDIFALDIYKLTFIVNTFNGIEVADILRNEYKIEFELTTNGHLIAMTSITDDDEIFDTLFDAMLDISKRFKGLEIVERDNIKFDKNRNSKRLSSVNPENTTQINLNDAVGRVCGKSITPYPPCVPLVVAGEVLTVEDIIKIKLIKNSGCSFLGVDNVNNELFVTVLKS